MANVGTEVPYDGEFVLDSNLLPYPNATLDKVAVHFNVVFTNPNVEVSGEIVCDVSGSCDRCLAQTKKQFVLPFDQTFVKNGSDLDEYVYDGSRLDATKAVCDEIILSLPTLFLCREDCKGLCPVCGVDRNTTKCDCDTQKENVFSSLKNLKF